MGAVAIDAAMNVDADTATIDIEVAIGEGNEAGGKLICCVDVAGDMEVVDGRTIDVEERGAILLSVGRLRRAVVEGQRVVVAVEVAGKPIVRDAHHQVVTKDVISHFEKLAAVAVACIHIAGQLVPVVGGTDDVRVLSSVSLPPLEAVSPCLLLSRN